MISFQFELIKMSLKESSAGKKREGHLHLRDVDGPLSSSSSERAGGAGAAGRTARRLCGWGLGSSEAVGVAGWVERWLPFFERSPTVCLLGFDFNIRGKINEAHPRCPVRASLQPAPAPLALSDPQAQPSS